MTARSSGVRRANLFFSSSGTIFSRFVHPFGGKALAGRNFSPRKNPPVFFQFYSIGGENSNRKENFLKLLQEKIFFIIMNNTMNENFPAWILPAASDLSADSRRKSRLHLQGSQQGKFFQRQRYSASTQKFVGGFSPAGFGGHSPFSFKEASIWQTN